LVAGNGEAGSLVAADQEQEEAGLLTPEGEIAERVGDEDPGIDELLDGPLEPIPSHLTFDEAEPPELLRNPLIRGRVAPTISARTS